MKPCKGCPWLRKSTLGLWSIDHLIVVCYVNDSPLFPFSKMGCHKGADSPLGQADPTRIDQFCGGWTRAADSVSVRMKVALGKIPVSETQWDPSLYPDPETMLRWNGVDVDALPSRDMPAEIEDWTREMDYLSTCMGKPDRLRKYIIPGSPMEVGVDHLHRSNLTGDEMDRWRADCQEWEAGRNRFRGR